MSDTPQSPDWWLASDGRWYPPTSRPAAAPPLGPGPYDSQPAPDWWLASDGKWYPPSSRPGSHGHAGYRAPTAVSRALAGWLQGLFWATGAAALLMAIVAVNAHGVHSDVRDGRARLSAWIDADDAFLGMIVLVLLGLATTAVLLMVWTYKAHQTTDRLGPYGRSWSRGWAVGSWFIPFGALVLPKLVLNEIERIATAPRSGGLVTPEWQRQPTSALGWAWWVAWVLGSILWVAALWTDEPDRLLQSADQIRSSYVLAVLSGISLAVSAACAAPFVRRISKRLSPTAMAESGTAQQSGW